MPVQARTWTAANQYASLGDSETQSILGIGVLPWPNTITITSITARLTAPLTGGGGSSIDVGIEDLTAGFGSVFANIALTAQQATGTGSMTVNAGDAIALRVRRNGTPVSSLILSGVTIGYTVDADQGFFQAVRDGSVAGSNVTVFEPSLVAGFISTSDGIIAPPTFGQKMGVVPIATTLKRIGQSNSTVPASNFTYQHSVGGVVTGVIWQILNGANPAFVEAALDLTLAATTAAAQVATQGTTFKCTTDGPTTMQPNWAYSYEIVGQPSRAWAFMGWGNRLGSQDTTYEGFNGSVEGTSQSDKQVPWDTAGTFKGLFVTALPQTVASDKTYEVHLEINGSSVGSVTFTNDAATIVQNSPAFSVAVSAGDLVNWRLQMNGGFTASRAINCMGAVGFEPA